MSICLTHILENQQNRKITTYLCAVAKSETLGETIEKGPMCITGLFQIKP